jgi:hypothetical protein
MPVSRNEKRFAVVESFSWFGSFCGKKNEQSEKKGKTK